MLSCMAPVVVAPAAATPVEYHPPVWVKRDDTYMVAGVCGGKARTCWALANEAPRPRGLVTAGSRHSPQVGIVAHVARELGLPAAVFVPAGPETLEVAVARAAGATVHAIRPGHNSVIKARARAYAQGHGWRHIPFGMECWGAVEGTAGQLVASWPAIHRAGCKRLVICVGSGMSLAGVLWGDQAAGWPLPVLGVCVGANPLRRLAQWAPAGWEGHAVLVEAPQAYGARVDSGGFGVRLDPVYEAKCLAYLEPWDLFWVVGRRRGAL